MGVEPRWRIAPYAKKYPPRGYFFRKMVRPMVEAGEQTEDLSSLIYGGEDPAHQSAAWLDPTGFDNICGGTEEQVEAMLRILNEAD